MKCVTNPFSAEEIAEVRRLFPVTQNWIYLNHAAVAPIGIPVAQAIQNFTHQAMQEGYTASAEWSLRVEQIRGDAARLLKVSPGEIAFVKNTSHGISLVARGLDWQRGDEVVFCETDFPANIYPWMALEKRGVVLKKIAPTGGELPLHELEHLITSRTRVVALSSVQYGNGYRLPVGEVGKLCRDRKVHFFLDAIQSLGAFPLDAGSEGVDFLAADGHKWMLGPEGIGLFYIRKELLDSVDPVLLGWNSVEHAHRFDVIDFKLRKDAARFEEGSPSTLSIFALGAAIEFLLHIGIDLISRRILYLTQYLLTGLERRGMEITNSQQAKFRSGIVTFRIAGEPKKTQDLERFLFSKKVYGAFRQGSLRLSPHFYNTEQELDWTLDAIDDFLANH